jgi:ribA/ribD-fused uncharacterized protein
MEDFMIDRFDGTKYEFLSNFHMAPVLYEGILYPSSEHAYQAAKSLDPVVRNRVAKLSTAGQSKKAGRQISIRPDWEQVKYDIMSEIVLLKFMQHPDLKEKLLATGDEELVEGNTWGDSYWGVCRGVGQNKLGEILMKVRKILSVT